MHHVHVSILAAIGVYLSWLLIRVPILLLAHRFHRSALAQAILQFG